MQQLKTTEMARDREVEKERATMRVGVVGLGLGRLHVEAYAEAGAVARLVVRLNGKAKISEMGDETSLSKGFKDWAKQKDVVLEFDGHTQKFIQDSDLIVLSPGVRLNAPLVQWAKSKSKPQTL